MGTLSKKSGFNEGFGKYFYLLDINYDIDRLNIIRLAFSGIEITTEVEYLEVF